MMLWYKAWCESRTRFLFSALTVSCACCFVVFYETEGRLAFADTGLSYADYIGRIIYSGGVRDIFVLFSVVLGLGGLLRECAQQTACFALALPISRGQWIRSRAAVGFIEVAMLSFLPVLLLPSASALIHETYPLSLALRFGLLWLVCGTLFFALGFFVSVVVGGEYMAGIVSLVAVVLYSILVDLPYVERFVPDIFDVMSGKPMPEAPLLDRTIPLLLLVTIFLTACAFVAAANRICERQDF
jgi:ABC-type transport system involved in multi-copper enzyme maturation permease subunit